MPDWKLGDMIPLGDGTLRVVDGAWDDADDEVEATLTVEVAEF